MYCQTESKMIGNSIKKLIKVVHQRERLNTGIFEKLKFATFWKRCFQRYSNNVKYNQRRSTSRKSAFAVTMAKSQEHGLKPQSYDYFLVLDFEATCQKDTQMKPQVHTDIW